MLQLRLDLTEEQMCWFHVTLWLLWLLQTCSCDDIEWEVRLGKFKFSLSCQELDQIEDWYDSHVCSLHLKRLQLVSLAEHEDWKQMETASMNPSICIRICLPAPEIPFSGLRFSGNIWFKSYVSKELLMTDLHPVIITHLTCVSLYYLWIDL